MSSPETPASCTVVLDGLCFPEGPRWHEGALWFSDVHAGQVLRLDPDTGAAAVMAALDTAPSGLGFLPDGTLLIASGTDRTVYRRGPDGALTVHADLSALASWQLNDMHVDAAGRAYVGDYGDGSAPPDPPRPADLLLVAPDGTARPAAGGMHFANGMATLDDGRTLVVAETRAEPGRLTAFTVAGDGALSGRRTLCTFAPGVLPDGIAADGAGNVWVASPFTGHLLRVSPSGTVDRTLAVPHPYAVAHRPGPGDGVLYVCSSPEWRPDEARANRAGAILRVVP